MERIKEVRNLSNLDEIADFLGINPSTLRSRKSRGSVPYDEIVSKLSAEEIGYVLKGPERNRDITRVEEPPVNFESFAPDFYEQFSIDLVKRIEDAPFSHQSKLQLIDTIIRIVEADLPETQKQSNPDPDADH